MTVPRFRPGDRVLKSSAAMQGEVQWLEGAGVSRVVVVQWDRNVEGDLSRHTFSEIERLKDNA